MAARGRKPKPTALKVLEGNPGKRPLNDHEPIPPKGELKCPSWLLPEAKKEWKRLASSLEAVSYTHLDVYKRQVSMFMCFMSHSSLLHFKALSRMLFITLSGRNSNPTDAPGFLRTVLFISTRRALIQKPVSYTHLDVYKRQAFTAFL